MSNLTKIIIGIVILLIIVIIVWYIIKQAKKNKGNKEEAKSTAKELAALNKNPATKQTITAQQADAMANVIFAAMDGYGTDATAIVKQLLMLMNQADWLALSDAFGIREVSSGKLNPEPNFKGTLQACLSNELGVTDSSTIIKLNKVFQIRKILVTL